jgi:hypothetical protein
MHAQIIQAFSWPVCAFAWIRFGLLGIAAFVRFGGAAVCSAVTLLVGFSVRAAF